METKWGVTPQKLYTDFVDYRQEAKFLIHDIEKMVFDAQSDRQKLNNLIERFLPFIKKCVAGCRTDQQSREDALTLAMLAFADSVTAYKSDKGAFLQFAQTAIRNRLIDDFRMEYRKTSLNVPLLIEQTEDENAEDWETSLSVREHERLIEQTSLRLEIEEASDALSVWGISFAELVKLCPKQKRTRAQCQYIATLILTNEVWQRQLFEKRKLPSKEMCEIYGVSLKTLEKYRKYIVTLCVIQTGDYPRLRAFLPVNRKEGVDNE